MNIQYKLYKNGKNDTSDIIGEFFRNREIYDYNTYLNLDEKVLISYKNLENVKTAIAVFMRHFSLRNKISILCDPDVDGFCSSAMTYKYIKRMDENYPVNYILHTRPKAHGLGKDVIIPEGTKLLIIPDAGTNDTKQCKELREQGIDIIILDHHEREKDNPYAIIVNNQTSPSYPNKDLCGAGVVYKFLQGLDEENWTEYADDYLDLCALANISDVMDLRSFETRYLVDLGLSNIKNKFFKALIAAQDYSINGKVNIHNVQWYLTSVLNGCIRFGSLEEKELLFRAFIEQDEWFEYKKRATKDKPAETIQESIYDRAARLSKNAKSRQDKQKDKDVKQLAEIIQSTDNDNNKIIMLDITDLMNSALTGVVAIKLAEMFNKPCILLNKFTNDDDEVVYGGSVRNVDNSPIDSIKNVINSTKNIRAQGHAQACGVVNLNPENKNKAFKELNNILKDVVYDSTYRVDFILDVEDISIGLINALSKFEDVICQGLSEPKIAVENISLTRDCFSIYGKNADTISFMIDGIKYIQFKCQEGNLLYDFLQDAWCEEDSVTFNIVGIPSINEYEGIKTPQVTIMDVEVLEITNGENENEDNEW